MRCAASKKGRIVMWKKLAERGGKFLMAFEAPP